MALLNGIYIFVKDEKLTNEVDVMTHPVEEGIDVTDHVRAKAQTIALTGKIVGANASMNISLIKYMQKMGFLVTYVGRNIASDFQITQFNTSHPNTVTGGCAFDMTLVETRIAESPYKAGKNTASAGNMATKTTTKTGMQQVVGR